MTCSTGRGLLAALCGRCGPAEGGRIALVGVLMPGTLSTDRMRPAVAGLDAALVGVRAGDCIGTLLRCDVADRCCCHSETTSVRVSSGSGVGEDAGFGVRDRCCCCCCCCTDAESSDGDDSVMDRLGDTSTDERGLRGCASRYPSGVTCCCGRRGESLLPGRCCGGGICRASSDMAAGLVRMRCSEGDSVRAYTTTSSVRPLRALLSP